MSKKYFVFLGLFLVAGFLFFNASAVKAETWTWTGQGDNHTWTDARNWGLGAVDSNANSYPGATTTADVVIGANARVIATTTIGTVSTNGLASLELGTATAGSALTVAKGATIYASSTVSIFSTSTLVFGDTTSTKLGGQAALNLGAGNLYLILGNSSTTPLTIGNTATFTSGTSTITYAGTGGVYLATTTYYNLTLTPTSTAATAIYTFSNSGNATTTNVLTIGKAAQLNFNGGIFELSNSGTAPVTPLVYVSTGSFVANSSRIVYSGTVATNVATGTYAILEISGAATKTLVGNTTAVTAVRVNLDATLAISTYTFTATGAAWTNSGTVSEDTGGKITLAATGILSDSAGGSAVNTFGNADSAPTVHIQITDTSLNLVAATAETKTVTVTSTSGITDSETITLTETTVSSGIFRGSVGFQLSGSDVSGPLDYQGNGTIGYSFTDPQDSSDIVTTGQASYTGTQPGGGGSSSGGSVATIVTTTTTTTTTTATSTTGTTATTPTTTAVPVTTVSTPTLESVQTKIASVIAKMATLSATPAASDLANVQAQIAAILADIQAIQTTATPQGVALGFNFVRPLALGLRHSDVSNLQKALKTDSSVYPEGLVTGYFGPATLRAVKKFQEKYGIASSGAAGYGNVGPATRAKLNELYGSK